MPFPPTITPITVTAKFLQADGSPCEGAVTFTPSITAELPGYIVPPSAVSAKLDAAGFLSVQLASTDDPQWEAPGFTYEVTEIIKGLGSRRSYNIVVPFNAPGGTLDLASIAPVETITPSVGSSYFLVAGGTITGNVTVQGFLDAPDLRLGGVKLSVDSINVKRFGAVGNGIADDTSAIQAAIDAVTVGTVYLPTGTYKITSALTLHSNVTLRGDGDGKTVISQASTGANGLTGVDVSSVTINNLRINGPGSGTGTGIKLTRSAAANTAYINIKNVMVYFFGVDGIELSNPIVSTFERVIAVNNVGKGFNIHGVPAGAAGTSCSFTSCYANFNTGTGWYFENMVYTFLGGCAADGNAIGYHFKSCQSVAAAGCGGEGNTTKTFAIEGGFGVTLTSPWVYNNKGIGIDILGGAGTITLIGASDNTPLGTATSFIKTIAGVSVTLINCSNVTANSLAAGTATTLVAANKDHTIPGYALFTGGLECDTDLSVFGGDVIAGSAGKTLKVKEGANAKMGTATLNGTTSVVVATTAVTALSRIQLTINTKGGVTPGVPHVVTRVAGTSFTIASTVVSDNSVVAWLIIEPA